MKTWQAILLYILVVSFLIFEMAVQVSPSIMTNQLMHDLNIGTFGLGLMSGIYFFTYTAMQIPSGLLYDRFNPRFIITISILVCAIGTLLFGMAHNIYVGCLARLLIGFGSAFAFVSVLVIVADLFQAKYFAFLTGITQMLGAFGAMSGQIPLSKLVLVVGWRDTMFVLAIIGFALAIITFGFIKYERNYKPYDSALLAQFKAVIANKQMWYIAIYACLLWAPMAGFASLWGVPYLTKVYGLSHTAAASTCSLMWLGIALFSPVLCWASTFIGKRVMPLTAAAIMGAIAFAMLIFSTNMPYWLIGTMVFVAGAACAGQALSFSVVVENNSRTKRATAVGFNNMAVVISGIMFQPLIGKLLQNNISVSGFKFSMLVILFSYIVAVLVSLFLIKETFCRELTKE